MSLALLPPPATGPAFARAARRGRPEVSTVPAERSKHLAVAAARLVAREPVGTIAARLDVERHTITRWVRLALDYPEGRWMLDLPADAPR